MFAEIHDGVTEMVGVTTAKQDRRQGFAAYLAGYMTQVAFARQVDIVFLITEDEDMANVYKRVGFQPCATLLTYRLA